MDRTGGILLFCQHCGKQIPDGVVFCNFCGGRQGVAAPAAPGPAPGAAPGYPAPPGPPQAPPYPGAAGPGAAPAPLPTSLKCNSCGGPLNPASGMALIVCEYCGAVTTMGTAGAQVFQKHFMLDSRLASNEQALETGGKWLNKGLFRRKVAERSDLGQVVLKYVPYWIIPTQVVADFQGTKGSGAGAVVHGSTGGQKAAGAAGMALGILAAAAVANRGNARAVHVQQPQVIRVRDRIQLSYNLPIVAVRGYTKFQPDDGFQFNIQAKRPFDKRATEGLEVMSGDVSEAEAKGNAAALAQRFAEKEARKRVDTLESIQVYPTTYDGELLHAPVWFMEYAHKGKSMFILIDSHSGQVMDGERPSFSLF